MDSNTRFVLIGELDGNGDLVGSLQVIDVQQGFAMKPSGDVKERDLLRSTSSDAGAVIGAKTWDTTLPVELKGGGIDTGVVQQPQMHAAFLACGMALEAAKMITVNTLVGTFAAPETLENTTQVEDVGTLIHVVDNGSGSYTLWVTDLLNAPVVTDALAGATSAATVVVTAVDDALCYRPVTARSEYNGCVIHAHYDGIRRIGDQSIGSFQMDWAAGEYASVSFTLSGIYATPTDQALPVAEYSDLMPPIGQNAGLTIAGYPGGTIEKLGFNLGNPVAPIPDINSPNGRHSYRHTGKRRANGSIDPEVLTLAEFDPFTMWEDGTKAAIHATLGDTAGERISIVITAAQFSGIGDKDRGGSDAYDLTYRATGTNNDEMYLFFH